MTSPKVSTIIIEGYAGDTTIFAVNVTYPGENPARYRFVGRIGHASGVTMILPGGTTTSVDEPGRFGTFSMGWVRRFFEAIDVDETQNQVIESAIEHVYQPGERVAHVSNPTVPFGVVEFGDELGAGVIENNGDTAYFEAKDLVRISERSIVDEPMEVIRLGTPPPIRQDDDDRLRHRDRVIPDPAWAPLFHDPQPVDSPEVGEAPRATIMEHEDDELAPLGLYCDECRLRLCDIEHEDSLAVLIDMARDHYKAAH